MNSDTIESRALERASQFKVIKLQNELKELEAWHGDETCRPWATSPAQKSVEKVIASCIELSVHKFMFSLRELIIEMRYSSFPNDCEIELAIVDTVCLLFCRISQHSLFSSVCESIVQGLSAKDVFGLKTLRYFMSLLLSLLHVSTRTRNKTK